MIALWHDKGERTELSWLSKDEKIRVYLDLFFIFNFKNRNFHIEIEC